MKHQTIEKINFLLLLSIIILQFAAEFMEQHLKKMVFFITIFLVIILIIMVSLGKKHSKF